MTGGVDGARDATNATPRIMTNAGAARAHARRSAMPEPYGVGWRLPTMATPDLVNTSGFPRTRRMSGGSSISFRRGGYDGSSNREPAMSAAADCCNLLPGQFRGLARGQRLGRGGFDASALQYSPRQARKTASADPRCLTSLRDFVGPRRGSRDGQPLRKMTPCGRSSGVRQNALRADSNSAERGGRESKSEVTIGFVKIVENATFTYFRHFLP
jgi:hypothetical protein